MSLRETLGRLSETVLEAIYPPLCALCGLASEAALCPACKKALKPWEPPQARLDPGSALDAAYQIYCYEGLAPQAVQLLKYQRWTQLGDAISAEVAAFARERGWFGAEIVVPVPIHWIRGQLRGFNQSELLCHDVPRDLLNLDLLRRSRWTKAQAKLDKTDREENLSRAFNVTRPLSGEKILLIDDVLTTGATLEACAKALKSAGSGRVTALTFTGRGDPLARAPAL